MWADQVTPVSLAGIARETGAIALVAIDQRAALRRALAGPDADPADDATVAEFKLDVVRALGPLASGIVTDRELGLTALREGQLLAPGTGLVLSADLQVLPHPTGPVDDTELDGLVLAGDGDLGGVAAVKLLIMWRRDDRRAARVELARRLVELAHAHGVASLIHPLVRPTDAELDDGTWNAELAMQEAAAELSVLGQSLYLTQVPLAGTQPGPVLDAECHLLSESIAGPWIVVSHGVAVDDLPDAVTAACRAGASGFLAGESWWHEIGGREDRRLALHEVVVPQLQRLCQIIDEQARPWAMPALS